MKSSRIALFAFALIVGLGTLAALPPASATDWSFLSNKNYVNCLQLFANGNFLDAAERLTFTDCRKARARPPLLQQAVRLLIA